jgi:hypothetical protein
MHICNLYIRSTLERQEALRELQKPSSRLVYPIPKTHIFKKYVDVYPTYTFYLAQKRAQNTGTIYVTFEQRRSGASDACAYGNL